jgi:uncharacterized protein YjiS (DUF1127 family)
MRMPHSSIADTSIVQSQHSPILLASKAATMQPQSNRRNETMAVTTQYTSPRGMLFAPLTAWVHTLKDLYVRRQCYRRTYNELSALSAHQLADLGLHRSTIRQAAYQAAYHQFR